MIRRIPKTQRYELTAFGLRTAVFFTKTHVRIVNPSLAELAPHLPEQIATRSDLARHWRGFEHTPDELGVATSGRRLGLPGVALV